MSVKTITKTQGLAAAMMVTVVVGVAVSVVVSTMHHEATAAIDPQPFIPHDHVGLLGCRFDPASGFPVVTFLEIGDPRFDPTARGAPQVSDSCGKALFALSTAGFSPGFRTTLPTARDVPDTLIWDLVTLRDKRGSRGT